MKFSNNYLNFETNCACNKLPLGMYSQYVCTLRCSLKFRVSSPKSSSVKSKIVFSTFFSRKFDFIPFAIHTAKFQLQNSISFSFSFPLIIDVSDHRVIVLNFSSSWISFTNACIIKSSFYQSVMIKLWSVVDCQCFAIPMQNHVIFTKPFDLKSKLW